MRQLLRHPAVPVAVGVLILVDVLRVFLPSLITIFGQAGGTPAELMGLYAVSWFVVAFATVGLARLVPAARVAVGAGCLLIAGRGALQVTHGGNPQLYLASVTVLAGLCWLIAVAMTTADARPIMVGLVAGLALSTGIQAGLDTIDLVWRTGFWPVLPLAVELGVFAAALLARAPEGPSTTSETPAAVPAAASGTPVAAPRGWLATGPAVLLWGLYTGSTAHAQATAGWQPTGAAVVVTVAGFLSIAVARDPARFTGRPWVPATGLVASAAGFAFGAVTIGGIHGVAPPWMVLAQVVGAFSLAGCLGWVAAMPGRALPGRALPYRRGLAMAGGLLLFVVLVFAYFAAYDLDLPNDYVPIVAALIVGLLAVAGSAQAKPGPLTTRALLGPLAGAVTAALAITMSPLWTDVARVAAGPAQGLRVASYNIRMGFGLAGTLTVNQQADTLAGLGAQVIALSEVDRAWLLNGGHDDLRLIANRLGMRYLWAPATDEVWGDALLTNLPVLSVRNHVLVQGGPTGAQALEVRLRWQDRDITVVATHLQPPSGWRDLAQAEQLADIVRAAPKPVILAGDLNTEPTDTAWPVLLAAGLTDPFAPVRPFNTMPTPDPAEQIDHILVTGDLMGRDQAHPDVPYSDHRPIAVTLAPR